MHRDNIRKIFLSDIDSKTSLLCIAEQTAVQVEQTKRGVGSPLPPPHQKRICNYGALPRLPLGNMALFLNRLGHRELSFRGRRQQTAALTLARLHICTYTTQTKLMHYHLHLRLPLQQRDRQVRSISKQNTPLFLFVLVHHHLCPFYLLIKMEPLD